MFGGEPGVAHGLLEQSPQCVAQLVGVKRRDAEAVGELAADVLCTGDGEAIGAGGLAGWKPMNRAGEWSVRAVR